MKSYLRSELDTQRIYRSKLRRKVSGVCAGLAAYFDSPVWLVRTLVVLAFLFVPVPVALAYLLGVLLLPSR